MLGYVVLLEHLQRLMYLYHVFTILQTVSIVLLMMTFWRKWYSTQSSCINHKPGYSELL